MSHQNLLEMDDLNGSSRGHSKVGKAMPRPLPRSSRIPKLATAAPKNSNNNKKERAVDDVMSFSSEGGSSALGISPKPGKRNVAFTTASFDNHAFVEDADGSNDGNVQRPKPMERRRKDSWFGTDANENNNGSPPNGGRWDSASKVYKDEDDGGVGRNEVNVVSSMVGNMDDSSEDEDNSAATFTIENEVKYKETAGQVKKKPPIPKPKRKGFNVPAPAELPRPMTRKKLGVGGGEMKSMESTSGSDDHQSYHGGDDTKMRSPSVRQDEPKINKSDHSAINIEDSDDDIGEPPNDNHNEIVGGDENIAKVADEQQAIIAAVGETASASSAADATLTTSDKQPVKKSRFGKLFANKSSKDNNKNAKKISSDNLDKAISEDGGSIGSGSGKEKGGGGGSIVNRWKKTFSRSTSKPTVPEEDEQVELENKEKERENQIEKSSSNKKEKRNRKEKKDTRIFMPEPENSAGDKSEEENSTDGADNNERPEKKSHENIMRKSSKPAVEKNAEESEEDVDTKDQGGEETEEFRRGKKPSSTSSKFKPFAKLMTSKSKESNKVEKKKDKQQEESADFEEVVEDKRFEQSSRRKKASETVVAATQHDNQNRTTTKEQNEFAGESSFSSSPSHSEEEEVVAKLEEKIKKSPEKRKARKVEKSKQPEVVPCVDSASGKDLLFGVTIHSSDLLPLDPNVIHPVIKVTVMFQNGEYMKKTEGSTAGISPTKDDVNDDDDDNRHRRDKREDKKSKRKKQKKSQKDNSVSTSNVAQSVLPIMSQPCRARHSMPTFAPTWNELLVFEEPFKRFTDDFAPTEDNEDHSIDTEPIIFFEVMDFLPMSNNSNRGSSSNNGFNSVTGFHGSDVGWYKICWAFLKPIGANGIMNLNRKLRLQLYKPVKLKKQKTGYSGPEVFSWWKSGIREKINCTLYVTPKGIIPPETRSASLRQLLSMRKEHLTQAILDSQLATKKKQRKRNESLYLSLQDLYSNANWTRMEGQSCKPPNKLVKTLPSSQIESLNIVISGNVYCTKFSPCGNFLACGLDTDELHVILLFKVPEWTLLKSLKGHHGIIYELTWKIFHLDDEQSFHYLASASADSTVRIWKMGNCDDKTISLVKVLYHPSYVYSVRFHPTHPSLVATGCFDFVIRIWDVKPDHTVVHVDNERKGGKSRRGSLKGDIAAGSNRNSEVSPIILLDKHSSFVNSLLFDTAGQHLFSGDGAACIFKWSCTTPSKKKSWRLEKDVKLHHSNIPVNCLSLHPSGSRLLVHLRDNFLKILDVVTLIPLQSFSGLHNEKLQIRSCFSPCGNLVLSGSEDSTLCVWDADTAKILQLNSPSNHPHCVVSSVDYHPFDYYVVVGLASTISEPSPILIYFYEQARGRQGGGQGMNYPVMLKRTAMRMRASLERSRSSRSQSTDAQEDQKIVGAYPSAKRGDSTEKFVSIIQKLDTALYFAQQRNKRRQTEAESSACLASSSKGDDEDEEKLEEKEKLLLARGREVGQPENKRRKSQYVKKKQVERPQSASALVRAKRERFGMKSFGEIQQERDTKSDSEQSYQLKKQITKDDIEKNKSTQLLSANDDDTEDSQQQQQVVQLRKVDSLEIHHHSTSKPPKPLRRKSIVHLESVENIENNNDFISTDMP